MEFLISDEDFEVLSLENKKFFSSFRLSLSDFLMIEDYTFEEGTRFLKKCENEVILLLYLTSFSEEIKLKIFDKLTLINRKIIVLDPSRTDLLQGCISFDGVILSPLTSQPASLERGSLTVEENSLLEENIRISSYLFSVNNVIILDWRNNFSECCPFIESIERKRLLPLLLYLKEVHISPIAASDVICSEICGYSGSEFTSSMSKYISQNKIKEGYKNLVTFLCNKREKEGNLSLNFDFYPQNNFMAQNIDGWDYAFKLLRGELNSSRGEIVLDAFIEKSFIFNTLPLISRVKLPYRNFWFGIAHHTFNDEFCPEGSASLIVKNKVFKESLIFCKGIITLSEYLKREYLERVPELSGRIFSVFHPVRFYPKEFHFSFDEWKKEKRIFSAGDWYRAPLTFAKVKFSFSSEKYLIRKYSLPFIFSGKNYANPSLEKNYFMKGLYSYFHTKNIEVREDFCIDIEKFSISSFVEGKFSIEEMRLIRISQKYLRRLKLIEKVPRPEFISFFKSNIFFLNLVDCSAANTIIEAISFNTPIIINRHPAVEEYLGKEYPLFYDDLKSVSSFTEEDIYNGWKYLISLDKYFLSIDNFISSIKNIVKSQNEFTLLH